MTYLLTQFRVFWTYIRLLILPINQNLDYDYPLSHSIFEPYTFISFMGILLILSFAVWVYKRQRLVTFFILWFFLILMPTSSIAVLPDVIFEHRLYLASAGFFVLAVMGIYRLNEILFKRGEIIHAGSFKNSS